jgi:hypothetical protein
VSPREERRKKREILVEGEKGLAFLEKRGGRQEKLW